jgi:uncharacterized protein (TIGR02246 family)
MKNAICTLIATIIASVLGNALLVAGEMTADEQAIRQSAENFLAAYDRGDATAVAAHWAKDGEYTIGQQTVKGREAIAKLYAAFLRAHPGSKMDIKIDSIRVLAPTVALEQGTAAIRNSANEPPSASSYSVVHLKQGDKWLMVSVRESEVPSVQIDRDLKELDWMVGKWSTGKDSSQATLNCEWMANKHFLRAEIAIHGKSGELPGGSQIIGRDPASGQIVSWFFSADGGFGTGIWQNDGSRWLIQSTGIAASGVPTAGTTLLYRADENVASWQSFNRVRGDKPLPDVKEIVIERVHTKN